MPFSNPEKNKLKDCVSLQVTRRRKTWYKISPSDFNTNNRKNAFSLNDKPMWERAFLFTSKASVTIEAAITITIFLLVTISLSSFLAMVYGQLSIEEKINNISMETSKAKYFVKYDKEKGEKYKTMAEVGYISARVFGDIKNNGKLINTLNPVQSKMDGGMVDVVLSYNIKIPFTSYQWTVTQRAKTKDWTGIDLVEPGEIVYITKYGSVYHRSKECKHLIININEVTLAQAKIMRNDSGHKYKRCSYCTKQKMSNLSNVFITPDGDRYHNSLDCLGLTRNVIEVDIKDVGDKSPCSSCGG